MTIPRRGGRNVWQSGAAGRKIPMGRPRKRTKREEKKTKQLPFAKSQGLKPWTPEGAGKSNRRRRGRLGNGGWKTVHSAWKRKGGPPKKKPIKGEENFLKGVEGETSFGEKVFQKTSPNG